MSAFMTCGKCGHRAALDAFCRGQHKFSYQCPACKRTEKVVDEKPTVLPNGFVLPGKRTVVTTP